MDAGLLFVGGWLGESRDWDAVRARLSPSPTAAFVPDGLAATSPPGEPWSFDAAAKELDRTLDRLPSAQVVIGSSIGGCIALSAAARRRLRGVIAIGTAARWVAGDGYPFGFAPESASAVLQGLRQAFAATVGQAMPAAYLDEADVATAAAITATIVHRARTAVAPERLVAGLENSLAVDMRAQLAALECPVLLISGERDHVVTPDLTRWTAAKIARCDVEIVPGAGHLPHVTAPEAVSRAIARFLSRLGGDD